MFPLKYRPLKHHLLQNESSDAKRCTMLLALFHAAAALQGVGRRGPCAVRRASACVSMALEWEECGGCQVLRPQQGRPRAMVHFRGGVAVSPAPQVAYRYLLEQLSERGYLVVATPYTVDFDYGKPVAEIRDKFDTARALLGEEFEELPLLGLGHSLGALMQTLLYCQHAPYAEACAGLALVSWNNKPVSDAPFHTKQALTLRRPPTLSR